MAEIWRATVTAQLSGLKRAFFLRKVQARRDTFFPPLKRPHEMSHNLLCVLGRNRLALKPNVLPWIRPWQPQRCMAQMQRSRPSRMTLSPKVGRQVERTTPAGRPVRKSNNSPFGGMNMKHANMTRAPDKRSPSAIRRVTRGEQKYKKDEKKEKGNDDTFHALKMQRALSTISYGHRNQVKARIAEVDSFDQFDLLPQVKASIATQGMLGTEKPVPTPIQRLAVPAMLGQKLGDRHRPSPSRTRHSDMEQFLIAAETGSGKTLAYLLPVIDAIKRSEAIEAEQEARQRALIEEKKKHDKTYIEPPPLHDAPHSTSGRPKAIILLPTSELVAQVATLAKSFSHTVKFRCAAISASYSPRVIRNRLFSPNGIDLLISTPHLLSSITTSDPYVLSRVSHIVVDEADSLLDRSFSPITSEIIDKSASSLKQLILCSATIPRSLDSHLRTRYPYIRRLVTPNLHAIPRRIQLGVVDVEKDPYRGNKDLACADTIYTIGRSGVDHALGESPDPYDQKRLLVFVNEREKAEELSEYLRSKGIDASALNRDTTEQRQSELLAQFTTQQSRTPEQDAAAAAAAKQVNKPKTGKYTPANKRTLLNTKVLVTTDLGSRGIDTLAVRHVILYDVPHSTIDFIHRLGRTGRMGRRGRGVVLVGKHDRRDVVREVREGMFRGQALI